MLITSPNSSLKKYHFLVPPNYGSDPLTVYLLVSFSPNIEDCNMMSYHLLPTLWFWTLHTAPTGDVR